MPTAPLQLRDDISWREIDGEIVLLDLSGSMYFTVNRTGIELWPLLVRGSTVDELTGRLQQTFALDRRTAERDVQSFLDALSGEGLLHGEV